MPDIATASVKLRDMRPDEYEAYTAERERNTSAALHAVLSPAQAQAEARRATERFLPQGLATPGHRLLVACDATGQVVGQVWLGLTEPRTGSAETAWLYDIRVGEPYRRHGYATAMLTAVEAIARDAGARSLGLNVFGSNQGAIALYVAAGYEVTTQQMAKDLR